MKVLFICNQNQNRSKTAEEIFRDKFQTKSAGLFNDNPVSEEEMSRADLIVVMEDFQRTELSKRFPKQYMQKKIISLSIPDEFRYNQPELVQLLESRFSLNPNKT